MHNEAEQQVREVVETYVAATLNADIEALKAVFHPEAHMSGYLGDTLLLATPAAFIDDIASQPSMKEAGDPYTGEILSLTVTGPIASVVLKETGFRGEGCLEDHFQLLLVDGTWTIISKNFTTL